MDAALTHLLGSDDAAQVMFCQGFDDAPVLALVADVRLAEVPEGVAAGWISEN